MGKRKASALALLSGYASGSGSDASEDSSRSSSQPLDEPPVQGPAGPPPAEARDEGPAVGPSWRPVEGEEYEELPEAPPEEEEEDAYGHAYAQPPPEAYGGEGGAADAPALLRHVSVPASLDVAPSLPPPPDEPCAPELQAKLQRYHALLQAGRSINAELRKSKGYRNPDFLQKIVEFFGIHEHGSCYPREVYDPDALLSEDYYDALTAAQRTQAEAREAERARRGIVEFTVGGTQPGTGGLGGRPMLPQQAAPGQAAQQRFIRW